MINLLKYYLKKRINIIIIISVILILLGFVYCPGSFLYEWPNYKPSADNNPLPFYFNCLFILCIIVPIFEFSFKMRKIEIDQLYSLPIKRGKFFLTKYLVGIVEIMVSLTIFFLFMLARIFISPKGHVFHLQYYYLYYLLSYFLVFVIYSFVSLIYTKCNTVYDGIICIILALLAPMFIFLMLTLIVPRSWLLYQYLDKYLMWPFCSFHTSFKYITDIYEVLMNQGMVYGIGDYDKKIYGAIITSILGILSFVIFLVAIKFYKPEDSRGKSTSWFSYKVLLPINTLFISLFAFTPTFTIFVIIISYTGYVIYRRSFKIKLWDIIIIIVCIVVGIMVYRS